MVLPFPEMEQSGPGGGRSSVCFEHVVSGMLISPLNGMLGSQLNI